MRLRLFALLPLTVSCGMPAEYIQVANFEINCPSLSQDAIRSSVDVIAKKHGFAAEVQESNPTYSRMYMDGHRTGNDIFVEFWASGTSAQSSGCSTLAKPCLTVSAFTLGQFPDDEQSEDAIAQRAAAADFRRLLKRSCGS